MPNMIFKDTIYKSITDKENRRFVDCTGDYNPLHRSEIMGRNTLIAGKFLEAIALELIVPIIRSNFLNTLEGKISTGFGNPLLIDQTARFDITGYDNASVKVMARNTSLPKDAKPVINTKICMTEKLEYNTPTIEKTYTRIVKKTDVDRYNASLNLLPEKRIPLGMALALSAPALLRQYKTDHLIADMPKDRMYAFILSNARVASHTQKIPIKNIDFGVQRISKDNIVKRIRLALEASIDGKLLYSAQYGLVLAPVYNP